MNTRLDYVDFIKGFAIIAVVFGHIDCLNNFPVLLPIKGLFATMWHVNLLFMVSGFFLSKTIAKGDFKLFVLRKIKTLYVRSLYFYLPAVLLHNYLIQIGWYDTTYPFMNKAINFWSTGDIVSNVLLTIGCAGREPILSALWFVYVLFFAMLVYGAVSFFASRFKLEAYKLPFVIILAVISSILSEVFGLFIPRCSNVFTSLLLVVSGQYLFQNIKPTFTNGKFAFIAFVVLYELTVVNSILSINSGTTFEIVTSVATAASALYIIAYLGIKIAKSLIGRFVCLCGRDSFYIMSLHIVGFKICMILLKAIGAYDGRISVLTPNLANNIVLVFIYLSFGVLFPLLFMNLFRKCKRYFAFVH